MSINPIQPIRPAPKRQYPTVTNAVETLVHFRAASSTFQISSNRHSDESLHKRARHIAPVRALSVPPQQTPFFLPEDELAQLLNEIETVPLSAPVTPNPAPITVVFRRHTNESVFNIAPNEANDRNETLIYKGEVSDGKPHGKGALYHSRGYVVVEGEFKNGLADGAVTVYSAPNQIQFEGTYRNGEMHEGTFYGNGEKYVGLFENNKAHGVGTLHTARKRSEGTFSNGKMNGYFKVYHSAGWLYYEGFYVDDACNGHGIEYDASANKIFEGEYRNGRRHQGTSYNENGNKYTGSFADGFIHGFGTLYTNSVKIVGDFVKNLMHGHIKVYDTDGKLEFEGTYADNKKNGHGIEYNSSGRKIFEGEFRNGYRYQGTSYDDNGNKYTGSFSKGVIHGEGTLITAKEKIVGYFILATMHGDYKIYNAAGTLKFEGHYVNNKREGHGIEYNSSGRKIFEGEYKDGKRV
jgi:antitoxin component YwqK of YwqJK toxin-antitoxin module